jgi:hypothetical protein
MNCPSCAAGMMHLELGARLGSTLEIDLCHACRAIWFDQYEDLRLSPAATLKVFGIISEHGSAPTRPLSGALRCPRCQARLLLTHDIQRVTPFKYWRCDSGHGRLMAFIDFLREKDFIRPLSPHQLNELRQNVQTINCSNCGGSIDLGKDSVCAHCGSAVSMLDLQQMTKTIEQLQKAAAAGHSAAAGAVPPRDSPDIDELVSAIKAQQRAGSAPNLIDEGLSMLGGLLRHLL